VQLRKKLEVLDAAAKCDVARTSSGVLNGGSRGIVGLGVCIGVAFAQFYAARPLHAVAGNTARQFLLIRSRKAELQSWLGNAGRSGVTHAPLRQAFWLP
jgi:hypothetical protein